MGETLRRNASGHGGFHPPDESLHRRPRNDPDSRHRSHLRGPNNARPTRSSEEFRKNFQKVGGRSKKFPILMVKRVKKANHSTPIRPATRVFPSADQISSSIILARMGQSHMNDTEPSSKRAEANRRNAQKSTGPRTAAGKERAAIQRRQTWNAGQNDRPARRGYRGLPGPHGGLDERPEARRRGRTLPRAARRAALLAARARRPRPGRPGRRRPLRRRRPRRSPGRRGRRPGTPPLLGPPRSHLLLSPVRDHPRRPRASPGRA